MSTKPNDPARIAVLEHEIQVLQVQKQAITQERADIAEQTKKAAERQKKAEGESALVHRGFAKSPPDPNPPRIGATAEPREQKALEQYRSLTLAVRSNFVSLIRSHWLGSRVAATDVVANAPELRKRRTLLSQVGLLASWMRTEVCVSIVDRVQKAKAVKDAEQVLGWAIADMRADLYRAVIADSGYFSFDKNSKFDQEFYYKLAIDWAGPVWVGDDPGLNHSRAPAWATEHDGRKLTEKFALARKYASGDAEIADLERAEKAGRCTPGDTLHLVNEMAGELGSAIEHKAVPAAREEVFSFASAISGNEAAQAKLKPRRPPSWRELDPRKMRISKLKAQKMGISSRNICVAMDKIVEHASTPTREALKPLESWTARAGGKRMWVELYDDPRTRNVVKKYINELPAALQRRS